MNNENSLYHYGIKGMRWGRRKGRSTSKGSSSTSRKTIGKKLAIGALAAAGTLLVGNIVYAERDFRKLSGGDTGLFDVMSALLKK